MTRDELIMLYYDGELDARDEARAEQLLESDAEARELLARLELAGRELETAVVSRAAPPDLTDAIMACIPAASAKLAPSASTTPARRHFRPRRALGWVSAGLALAAAFAVALTRTDVGSMAKSSPEHAAPAGAVSAPEPDAPQQSVAIERIDFGEDPGAIFLVPGENERTIVVWTMDDAADNGADEVEL